MSAFDRVRSDDGARARASGRDRARGERSQLLRLQRLAGNAAVSNLIAQRQDDASTGDAGAGGSGGGGAGGLVTVTADRFRKQALIDVTSRNGSVTDATVTIS